MGKYLNMLREGGTSLSRPGKKAVRKEEPVEPTPLVPGVPITWLGNDVPAILDFLHTEPDGSVWAFVTLPNGWATINAKYVKAVGTF